LKNSFYPQFPQFCIFYNVEDLSTSCGNDVEKFVENLIAR